MDRAQPVDAALLCLPNESKPPPAAFVGARYVHGKVALARALNEGQMHRSPEDERFMNLFGAAAQVVTDQVRKTISAVVGAGESYGAGLVSILQFEGRSVDVLSRTLGISHSGTVRLVDRLEADGLVRRRHEGRATLLFATPRGRRVGRRIEAARLDTVSALVSGFSPSERKAFEPLLRALLKKQTCSFDDVLHTCRICSLDACLGTGEPCPVATAITEDPP